MESPYSTRPLNDQVHYNMIASYRLDSDIHVPYGYTTRIAPNQSQPELFTSKDYERKHKSVAWIVSHCPTASHREDYVKQLQEYINVDVYGKCGTLECPQDQKDCFFDISKNYYFYLSFENAISKDYLTEKIFRTLRYPILPVVFGGANYSQFLPPNSFIDARQYEPKSLALYLKYLMKNEQEYRKYFEWKKEYEVHRLFLDGILCKTCEYIENNKQILHSKNGSTYNQLYEPSKSFWDNFPFATIFKITFLILLTLILIFFYKRNHKPKYVLLKSVAEN